MTDEIDARMETTAESAGFNPVRHNRGAWDRWVAEGDEWTVPVSAETIAGARQGDWSVVLVGHERADRSWFPAEMAGVRTLYWLRVAASKGRCSPRPVPT